MIAVKRDHYTPPAILISPACFKKIEELLESSIRKFSRHYYADEAVRKSLCTSYHNKCAYCESLLGVTSPKNIDHYRPKGKVQEEPHHPGYYWLVYEWSNLLPACTECNKTKLNHFPIKPTGKRVTEPIHKRRKLDENDYLLNSSRLKNENPLLLHPEIDEPEKHLKFLPNGEIEGITQQGKKTIEICNLNREGLILSRKKNIDVIKRQIENFLRTFIELLEKSQKSMETIERSFLRLTGSILDMMKPSKSYSRLAWFMLQDFNSFFIEPLSEDLKQEKLLAVVRKAFETFIEKHE